MHLGGAGLAQHRHHGPRGGAADDRIVDHDESLTGDVVAQRVELHAHAERTHLLVRRDERASDVAVLHQSVTERDAGPAGEPLGGGDPRLGHAHHEVGVDRGLIGQLLAHAHPRLMDALAVETGVGPGEVDELEQTQLGIDRRAAEGLERTATGRVDDDHLARVEFTDEMGSHDVECRALGGEHPSVVELSETHRPEAVRIAHADQVTLVHPHHGERALETGEHGEQGPFERAVIGRLVGGLRQLRSQQLRHDVGVRPHGSGQHPKFVGESGRVDEVAVVRDGHRVRADIAVHRLRIAPHARTRRGVPRVADGQMAGERGERAVVERVRHQTRVLDHGDGGTVAHGHARRLLPAVLQREQPEVGEVRHRLTGGVDTEDPARLLRRVRLGVEFGIDVDHLLIVPVTGRSAGAHDGTISPARCPRRGRPGWCRSMLRAHRTTRCRRGP